MVRQPIYGLFIGNLLTVGLAFLMRHRGETVSKTEILENVWDPAFDGDPNVVEVYIRYLRLKLDAPFNRTAIQTVRGMGYRIDPDGG